MTRAKVVPPEISLKLVGCPTALDALFALARLLAQPLLSVPVPLNWQLRVLLLRVPGPKLSALILRRLPGSCSRVAIDDVLLLCHLELEFN